jgi:hypothetical protein
MVMAVETSGPALARSWVRLSSEHCERSDYNPLRLFRSHIQYSRAVQMCNCWQLHLVQVPADIDALTLGVPNPLVKRTGDVKMLLMILSLEFPYRES